MTSIDFEACRPDAYDEPPNVPTFRLNDSSSDSGGSAKTDTHPEVCWETLEWIRPTDSLDGTSLRTRYDKGLDNPVGFDMLDLTGYRCRQHACVFGAKGKTDCRSCNAFTELLDRYGFKPEKIVMKCDLHPQQDNKSCVICANQLAMREVGI